MATPKNGSKTEQSSIALEKGKSNAMPQISSRQELLREAFASRGIVWSGEFDAPQPDILDTFDALSLCDNEPTVKGAEKSSKMFWKLGEPKLQASQKEGAKQFMVMEAFHEDWGPILLTHVAVYNDDSLSPLYEWVKNSVPKGGVFRFATFGTQKGYHVIRPVPVA